MPVYFGGGQVDMDTVRRALGLYDNATGPNRYEPGDFNRFRNLVGRGHAMSDWWNVNFYGYVIMYQSEGFVYDGCAGRDHSCYYDGTDEYGGYVGPFGGGSTYNTERGYNNGTFLTFGYGYSWTYFRPYSYHNYVSYSSGPYNCRAFYVDILRNGGQIASNFFGYSGGDHYTQHNFESGFQSSESINCRLILWY
jgi:hypothetical protein